MGPCSAVVSWSIHNGRHVFLWEFLVCLFLWMFVSILFFFFHESLTSPSPSPLLLVRIYWSCESRNSYWVLLHAECQAVCGRGSTRVDLSMLDKWGGYIWDEGSSSWTCKAVPCHVQLMWALPSDRQALVSSLMLCLLSLKSFFPRHKGSCDLPYIKLQKANGAMEDILMGFYP